MTDPQVIGAFATAAVLVIGALGTMIISILKVVKELKLTANDTNEKIIHANEKIDNAAVRVVENDRKTDAIALKTEEIKILANGKNDALQSKLDAANQLILRLTQEKAAQVEKLNEVMFERLKVDRRVSKRRK